MMKYDIIIPSSKQDISFLPKVCKYIRKNLQEADKIFVITAHNNFNKLNKYIKEYNVVLLDENRLCPGLSFSSIDNLLKAKGVFTRTGWHFQQFLKMGFALSEYAGEFYLSWDADTLPLSRISFFDKDSRPLFTMKNEYHVPYFETMTNLIGLGKTADFSFIAEHMMFKTEYMKELLTVIENSKNRGNVWFEKIINASVDLAFPGFSEFETYGTFVWVKHAGEYGTQRLNTFREAGMIKGRWIDNKSIEKLAFDLDTASFEMFSNPPFPYNIPNIKATWKRRWKQVKNRKICELTSFLIVKLKELIVKKHD